MGWSNWWDDPSRGRRPARHDRSHAVVREGGRLDTPSRLASEYFINGCSLAQPPAETTSLSIGRHQVGCHLVAIFVAAAFAVLLAPGPLEASGCHPGRRPTSASPLVMVFGLVGPHRTDGHGRPIAPVVGSSCPRDSEGGPTNGPPWGPVAAGLVRTVLERATQCWGAFVSGPGVTSLPCAPPPERPPRSR